MLIRMLASWAVITVITFTLSSSGLAQSQSQKARQAQERLDAVLGFLDDQIDHSVYDLDAFATKLGNDPESIASQIQNSIAYRPYWGALKGGDGVLVDRTGNALDQSLLLAEVLEHHGYSTRIGYAHLDAAGAQELLALAEHPIPIAPASFELSPEILAVLLNEGGMTPDQIKAAAAEAQTASAAHQSILDEKLENLDEAMGQLMGTQASALGLKIVNTDAIAMAAEYFWVEYENNSGSWTPVVVVPLTRDDVVSAAEGYFPSDELPENLTHSITISAALLMADGDAEPVSLGEVSVASNADYFAPITLINRPILTDEPTDLATAIGISSVEPENMRFEIAAGGAYALRLDYDLFGNVSELSGPGLSNDKSLLDITKQLDFELIPSGDKEDGPRVSGLQISYSLHNSRGLAQSPKTLKFERLVVPHDFHAGPNFKDAGFGSPWNANISTIPYAVTEEYMAHRVLKKLLTDMRQLAALFATGRTNGEVPLDPLGIHVSDAYATALIARDISQKDDVPVTFYVDQMSVIVEEVAGFAIDGNLTLTSSIDLMQVSERHSAIEQTGNGLGWTIAETLRPGSDGAQETNSAFDYLMVAASNSGTSVTKIDSIEWAQRFGVEIANDLKPELDNGFDIYLVSHLNDAAWFSRDPKTGMVIGRLKGGRGGSASEKTMLEVQMSETALNVADAFVCVMNAALNNDGSGNVVDQLHVCAANLTGNIMSTWIPGAAIFVTPIQFMYCIESGKARARCFAEALMSRSGTYTEIFGKKSINAILLITVAMKAGQVAFDGTELIQTEVRKK